MTIRLFRFWRLMIFAMAILTMSGCGFQLQTNLDFPPNLKRVYIQSNDPYGRLTRLLNHALKQAQMTIVSTPKDANATLHIISETSTQDLLNISVTQLTRQYQLSLAVQYELTDQKGRTLLGPETITESHPLTIQSSRILGGTNESEMLLQQLRRSIIMQLLNRLASESVRNAFKESDLHKDVSHATH